MHHISEEEKKQMWLEGAHKSPIKKMFEFFPVAQSSLKLKKKCFSILEPPLKIVWSAAGNVHSRFLPIAGDRSFLWKPYDYDA